MKKICIIYFILLSLPTFAQIQFTQNQNQWDKNVQFRADLPDGFLFLKNNALQYSFYQGEVLAELHHKHPQEEDETDEHKHEEHLVEIPCHSFEVEFLNANPQSNAIGKKEIQTKRNYFLGNNPQKWASNVSSFQEIFYPNLYEGIDLKLYQTQSNFKYEFHLKPHINPEIIQLHYKETDSLFLDKAGNLHIKTSINEIIEKKPVSYQMQNGKQIIVETKFHLENHTISFKFPKGYDPSQALLIDPDLIFSTYSGAMSDNWGFTATYDSLGNVYSGGIVFGANFPTTLGAFQTAYNGTVIDIGILQFNPTGTILNYATFLGGIEAEFPHSLVVNSSQELYILGTTGSSDFPTTTTAFDTTFNGGTAGTFTSAIPFDNGLDIFVAKLNSTGSSLLASTFLGGSANDGINESSLVGIKNYGDEFRSEIFADQNSNIYIASTTQSSDFPTQNPAQANLASDQDAIITCLNSNLTALNWSTYLGGNGFDGGFSLRKSYNQKIYVCGGTTSSNLSTNTEVIEPNHLGYDDGFVARFSDLGVLERLTYIGTDSLDQSFFVDTDSLNNVYVFGQTLGIYNITPNTVFHVDSAKQFIHKITPNLDQTLMSTTIGSDRDVPDIVPTAFLVDECDKIYLAGWGGSINNIGLINGSSTNDLPITPDAFQSTTDGNDFYIAILSENAEEFLYGTFFGSQVAGLQDHVDGGTSRFDKKGIIYHSVCASCGGNSTGFPTTPGVWSSTNNSTNCNNAVFKFDVNILEADFKILDPITNDSIDKGCVPTHIKLQYEGRGEVKIIWDIAGLTTVLDEKTVFYTFNTTGTYPITLTVEDCAGRQRVITKTIEIFDTDVEAGTDLFICFGESIQLNAISSNGETFTWTPVDGLSDTNILNPIANPTETTTYFIDVESAEDCVARDSITVNVEPPLEANFQILDAQTMSEIDKACVPQEVIFRYTGANIDQVAWEIEGLTSLGNQNDIPFSFTDKGSFNIIFKATKNAPCPEEIILEKEIDLFQLDLLAEANTTICVGDNIELNAFEETAIKYTWSPSESLDNSEIPNPIASPSENTIYTVIAEDANGCVDSAFVEINVQNEIELDWDFAYTNECGVPAQITLENNTSNATFFVWDMGDGSILNGANPSPFVYEEEGSYRISFKAYTGDCESEEIREIQFENNSLEIPNVITPNNDNKNDVWILPYPENRKVEIFNRWGERIFEAENYQNDWGESAKKGTYFYHITSPLGVICKGWLQVLR